MKQDYSENKEKKKRMKSGFQPRNRREKIIAPFAVLIMVIVVIIILWAQGVIDFGSSKGEVEQTSNPEIAINAALRMGIWDMTEDNPIPERAEIWIEGFGSWYFKKTYDEGKPVKIFGKFSVGVEHKFSFYPTSRSGEEIIVLFKLTEEMNPEGSVRDSLWISYSDEEVEVSGLPITAATGKTELKFKRK